ncbi:transcriptional regulator, TetR family [Chitinophaga costaii]|uniref:Transcriptional regulator, TetR family n=1 Tax=Chitinophaga costaii TaxID=1335309 RepID=A0A1C4FKA6_9BACT|nr:TetR/AcrR family transcriptional regulator [Chitinophaga costaii]PUZ30004.1 TetR/AcrR family transcriptional regulator [Chitinophaga costaii]SCC56266.1 transcriptional regulator, TetR family [Chitinophaga costaii]
MTPTKLKIIKTSERLFFEYGIANVRLQHIADEVGISVGNLAYHYKNKEAIVVAVYDCLLNGLSEILSTYLVYPDLSDFDKQFSDLFSFLNENIFYINNIWEIERTYPDIKKEWALLNKKILLQLKKRIKYNLQRNIIKPESYPKEHEILAQSLFLSINFWIPQQLLQGLPVQENLFKKALWALLFPYFTPKGIEEFTNLIMPVLK